MFSIPQNDTKIKIFSYSENGDPISNIKELKVNELKIELKNRGFSKLSGVLKGNLIDMLQASLNRELRQPILSNRLNMLQPSCVVSSSLPPTSTSTSATTTTIKKNTIRRRTVQKEDDDEIYEDEFNYKVLSKKEKKAIINSKRKTVAIIGSSGGGVATLGGGDVYQSLSVLRKHLSVANIKIGCIQFVHASDPLDIARPDTTHAKLWQMKENDYDNDDNDDDEQEEEMIQCRKSGSLKEINEECKMIDEDIAEKILQNKIDALILISTDVDVVNKKTISAAAMKRLPCVGTGGTSIGKAISKGCNIVNAGGSVATNPATRAMSFTAALARELHMEYNASSIHHGYHFHSILNGTLPAFIVAYMVLVWEKKMFLSVWPKPIIVQEFEKRVPRLVTTVVTAVAADEASCGMGSVGILAGAIASSFSDNSIIASLCSGLTAGYLTRSFLIQFYKYNFPATAATIFASGLAGLMGGIIGYMLQDTCYNITEQSRQFLYLAFLEIENEYILLIKIIIGALLGPFFLIGSRVGLYHLIFLPLILIEMEKVDGEGSLLGTFDESTLVIASLAICMANGLIPRRDNSKQGKYAARRAASINFWFGDFVEAVYPYYDRSSVTYIVAILASSISGSLICFHNVKSSAYLPLPLIILLSNNPWYISLVYGVMFFPIFIAEIVGNIIYNSKLENI